MLTKELREKHRTALRVVLDHRRAIARAELERAQRNMAFELATIAILEDEWGFADTLYAAMEAKKNVD